MQPTPISDQPSRGRFRAAGGRIREQHQRLYSAAFLVAAMALTGCANRNGDITPFLRAEETDASGGQYVVRPPDLLRIHAAAAPEIDAFVTAVGPDGKIVLRLLGEVHVAGLTPQQISEKLRAQLSRYYVDPEVIVEVTGFRSQFYYVLGEVNRPGAQPCTGHDTLLQVLANAVPNQYAWKSQVRVVRPDIESGKRHVMVVDLDKMVATGDTSANILLQPGDIIEVPPTPLAWLGHRVRDVWYPVSPLVQTYAAPTGAFAATDIYDDHIGGDSNSRNNRNVTVLRP